ncbi:MAG: hypothetical protein OXF54_12740 [Caldilineaceae bacterium]|nr:hypothetical protein [Caldilineaceae bacterium]
MIVVETYDYFDGQDRIHFDSEEVLAWQRSEPKVEIAIAHPPDTGAELKDLATILAKMDSADSSEKFTTSILEFSDCFLSNLTARDRVEGLGDSHSGFGITPAQITAVTLFQAGVFAVVGQFEKGRGAEQDDSSPLSVNMLELLEGAPATCKSGRPSADR